MHAAELPQLDLGTVRLRWLYGGAFRMDGAAVFGQLPRPVWSTLLAPDDDNRVGLAARAPDGRVASELRAPIDSVDNR
jgi:hypothetical protein